MPIFSLQRASTRLLLQRWSVQRRDRSAAPAAGIHGPWCLLLLGSVLACLALPVLAAQGGQGEAPQWTDWWRAHRQDYLVPHRLVPSSEEQAEGEDGTAAKRKIPKVEEVNEFARAQLTDPMPGVRTAAAFLLARTAGAEALPQLLERLEKEDGVMQHSLLLAIGMCAEPDAIEALMDIIKDGMLGRQRLNLRGPAYATLALGLAREQGQKERVDKELGKLLRQRKVDDEVVHAELMLAALSPAPDLEELCMEQLRNRQAPVWVRRRAAASLASYPSPKAAKVLLDTFGDASDVDLVRTIALALGAMPGDEHAKALIKLYGKEGEQHVRAHLLTSLGRNAGVGTLDALIEAYEGSNTALRDFALIGLALYTRDIEAPRADDVLLKALADRSSDTRKEVVALACGLGRVEGAITQLAELLATGDTQPVRANSALALGFIGTAAAREHLLAAGANQKGSQTLPEVIGALGLIGDSRDGEQLVAWTKGLSATERRASAIPLLALHGSVEVIDGLVSFGGDQSEDGPTRAAALQALGLLYEDGPRPISGRPLRFELPALTPEWMAMLWTLSY
jgi:HEAT repeat protein